MQEQSYNKPRGIASPPARFWQDLFPPTGICPNYTKTIVLAGNTPDTFGTMSFAKLRCRSRQCEECSKMLKWGDAQNLECGMETISDTKEREYEEDDDQIIKDNGGVGNSVLPYYSKTQFPTLARYKIPWYIGTYSEEEWDKIRNRIWQKTGKRRVRGYYSIRYEQEWTVIADGQLPNAEEMAPLDAFNKGIAKIASIEPDEWYEEERYGTCREPLARGSNNWPRVTSGYRRRVSHYEIVGAVYQNREMVQKLLDSWEQKQGRSLHRRMWQKLPTVFTWAMELGLHDFTPNEIVTLLYNLQVIPRKGEEIPDMVKRLSAIWQMARSSMEGGAA